MDTSKTQISAKSVRESIKLAFSGVKLGSGIGLYEASAHDDYAAPEVCAEYRAKDEKEDWSCIPVRDLNKYHSSLSFFDAEGMRFHIPAYILADLDGNYHYDLVFQFVFSSPSYTSEQFSLLNEIQRDAICQYLLYLESIFEIDSERKSIRNTVSEYWSK